MNRHSFLNITASIVAAILTVSSSSQSLHAQETSIRAKANVPFAFQVGARHFAPGIYTITMERNNIIAIRNGSDAALSVIGWDFAGQPSASSKLVFHRYGDKYFLSELWTEGTATHFECAQTAEERKAKKEVQTASVTYNSNVELALMPPSK
jgi:hypothetical protein